MPDGLLIPGSELDERFSRSSGPGGQSVNTTDSRVELRWDIAHSDILSERQRAVLVAKLGPRLRLTAQTQRSQTQNRMAARQRLAAMIRAAMVPAPPPRRSTRPTLGSKERRLTSKRQRAQIKRGRGEQRGRPIE